MPLRARFAATLRTWFRGRALERDLSDELQATLDELSRRHVARGLDPDAARRAALVELGGVEQVKEQIRDVRPGTATLTLASDIRYAVRLLRRAPAFTGVVVATLALAIGANTAIFSIVHAMLLAPLPYRDADRLLFVWSDMTSEGYPRAPLSGPELQDLRDRSTTCAAFAAIWSNTAALTGDRDPEQLRIGLVSDDFFDVLGAAPALGRAFRAEDAHPGPPPSIILSWPLFQRRYGGDPGLIGQKVLVNDRPTTVVGVMPEHFRLLLPADSAVPDDLQAWMPFQSTFVRGPRGQQYLRVIGRMKPGVTADEARQDISAIAARISRDYPDYGPSGRAFTTVPLRDDSVREIRPAIVALFAGVGILLLIACVNVANLLVARAAARRPEFALRLALGAERGRLVRQQLVEGLLLAGCGCGAGLVVGQAMLSGLTAFRPESLSRIDMSTVNLPVLAFAVSSALVWGLLFSLAPVAETFRTDLSGSLQRHGRGTAGALRYRTRAALVTVQVALSAVLLIAAALFARTFVRILGVDPGFRHEHVLTFRAAIPMQRYRPRDGFNAFAQSLQQQIAAIPGVQAAGAISHLPYDDLPNWGGGYRTPDTADRGTPPNADYRTVTPGAFEALGVSPIEGRLFTEADRDPRNPVILVDQPLARRLWPGRSAIGRVLLVDPGSTGTPAVNATVVGVVPHLRLRSLVADLTDQVYFPQRLVLRNPMAYVVRTTADPAAVAADVRQAISSLDPRLPIYDIRPLDTYVTAARSTRRFTLMLTAAFAVTALALASLGVYGVLAFAVARRRHEFGVRLALGAAPRQLAAAVMREGLSLAGLGALAGAAVAVAGGRYLQAQLYGVTPHDPAAFGIGLLALAFAAVLASWLPARRAISSRPMDALRAE